MGDIEIRSDIALPDKRASYRVWPFEKMEVGDSFLVSEPQRKNAASAASLYGMRTAKKFSVLKYQDAYRCWRIS